MVRSDTIYTVKINAEVISVSEFRRRISHLETIIHCDRRVCVSDRELSYCAGTAKLIGLKLINSTCARANLDDWERRERIIEGSAVFIDSVNSWLYCRIGS